MTLARDPQTGFFMRWGWVWNVKWMVVSKGDGRCRGLKFRWTLNRYESMKNACRNASHDIMYGFILLLLFGIQARNLSRTAPVAWHTRLSFAYVSVISTLFVMVVTSDWLHSVRHLAYTIVILVCNVQEFWLDVSWCCLQVILFTSLWLLLS